MVNPRLIISNPTAILLAIFLLSAAPDQDRLWHYRNLGKAFYENPTTQKEAVEQFRKALELAPSSARERVNYGLALLKAGDTKEAIAELEKAQKEDPSIPHTWFNLGVIAKRDGDYSVGIKQMEQMVKLVPDEPTAHHNLAALYKLAGRPEDAVKEFEKASKLNPNLAGPHFQLYNAYRQAGRQADAARELAAFQEIKKRTAGAAIPEDMDANNYTEIYDTIEAAVPPATLPEIKFAGRTLAKTVEGIAPVGADLIAWTPMGAVLYRDGKSADIGMGSLKDIVSITAGDYDNDGLPDLCVITRTGAALYHNDKEKFTKSSISLPSGSFNKALWIDYDHDYDLDLMLLGSASVLLRNNGDAGFSDQTVSFPFAKGNAIDAARFAVRPETAARDLVVSYEDHAGILYEDRLNGVYTAGPYPMLPAGVTGIAAADLNHDSLFEIVYPGQKDLPPGASVPASLALGNWVGANLPPLRSAVSLDWNVAGITDDGTLHVFENQTTPNQHWLRVGITGIKNLKLATSATIEVKAGAKYQKRIYDGAPLLFPLDAYTEADTVRITWPNGLIQNEPKQPANHTLSFPEAQRLSGSCPMIFTWNGREFQFITDLLGVAPLGASAGDGHYFPVDHDEYVQIPGSALRARAGAYEIRITEELHEVSYLDQVRLIAVDHPRSEEIFTNDKFKAPPFPEFRLFGVKHKIYPASARDDQGRDVLPALLRRDGAYPDAFDRDYTGIAQLHTLDLDFGSAAADGRAVLVLNGWVDWADGSTFLGASQRKSGGLVLPYLQVKDTNGAWQTVIEDMGIPSGKPKTISVDLTGKFLSRSRAVRIVTNLCVYWDEIFLSQDAGAPDTRLTPSDAEAADLHFRGFSTPVIDPRRKQPERFEYSREMPLSMWNPTPGNYTRYGDVLELVTAIDDRLLIMGSGDEVTLHFPQAEFPALPQGWQRDFLLLVDGWAKDADANTAFSQTVEPLPFHGMSAYPYRKDEHFPADPGHLRYVRQYNTRPALRLIRPLVMATE